jgi:DNA-binding NtrC family response regulator
MALEAERILVVDDSPKMIEVIERTLTQDGYQLFSSHGVGEAVRLLESTHIDLVITDWKMPKVCGLDLVRYVRENLRDTEVMMITGYATVDGAVAAVKAGADEYLSKPFTAAELRAAVRRTLDKLGARLEAQTPESCFAPEGLIGRSAGMQEVFRLIARAATTNATVLISGESGTGKECVARAIHYSGPRASAPFVPINCGGIPEGLLESELFGHVKGAFTGAMESRAGFFQTADGGTIFLDEIGETSGPMQVKLLRVLQDKEVCMVGASKTAKVDVRVVAATNKDLTALVEKGIFREDLYFRLDVVNILLPPLRERPDDVPPLINHFVSKFAEELGRDAPVFTDDALHALARYSWPGNVRELENLVQRSLVMSDEDRIDVTDLPQPMRFTVLQEHGLNRTLAEVEVEHIRNVLANVDDNKTKAARILGISRKTLRDKLKPSP